MPSSHRARFVTVPHLALERSTRSVRSLSLGADYSPGRAVRWQLRIAARVVGENDFAVTSSSGPRLHDNPNNPAIGDT